MHVDAVLIEQALGQVLDNAAKYSPKGSAIQIEGCRRNGDVCIVVRDQGAGLSIEERTNMFERFYRGSRTATMASGSGLGLWIARAFVVACSGGMDANSEGADLGTTVTITLPVHAGASGDVERMHDG